MSGIVPRRVHAVLDYLYAGAALAAPKIGGFEDEPKAKLVCQAHGIATLKTSLLTDYELGLVKKIPFKVHLMIDLGAALFGLASPWLFGFSQNKRARNTILGLALFEILAVAASRRDDS
jgi:hypothetical protein